MFRGGINSRCLIRDNEEDKPSLDEMITSRTELTQWLTIKHVFIFKMGFRMSFHFQNVVLFQNALSFLKCKRFCDFCFSFFRKTQQHNCKQTAVHSFTTNSFTDEVVNKLEIYMKLSNLFLMAVGVVEFSREGYKIRKDFS